MHAYAHALAYIEGEGRTANEEVFCDTELCVLLAHTHTHLEVESKQTN